MADTRSTVDRSDPEISERIFRKLVPPASVTQVAKTLVSLIRHANLLESASWCLSLFADMVRLNVGQVELFTIRRGWLRLVTTSFSLSGEFAGVELESTAQPVYRSVPIDSIIAHVDLAATHVVPAVCLQAARAYIEEAAHRKRRSPFSRAHSVGLVQYLESEVSEHVPQPSYVVVDKNRHSDQVGHVNRVTDDLNGRAFLFSWNPTYGTPETLLPESQEIERVGSATTTWRSGSRRTLPLNSRAFLIRLGSEPRGIVGAGWTRTEPDETPRIEIEFEVLGDAPFVPMSTLKSGTLATFGWSIQGSGVLLPEDIAQELEALVPVSQLQGADAEFEGEEGSAVMRSHLAIERDRRLVVAKRSTVLHRDGRLACEVCGVDFLEMYGERGRNFCEVHHRFPLGGQQGARMTRLGDLAILCANCHRMIHREPFVSVDELRAALCSAALRRSRAQGQ